MSTRRWSPIGRDCGRASCPNEDYGMLIGMIEIEMRNIPAPDEPHHVRKAH
jgi:hypothetical protein